MTKKNEFNFNEHKNITIFVLSVLCLLSLLVVIVNSVEKDTIQKQKNINDKITFHENGLEKAKEYREIENLRSPPINIWAIVGVIFSLGAVFHGMPFTKTTNITNNNYEGEQNGK